MPRRRVRPEDAASALDRLTAVVGGPLPTGWVPPPEEAAPTGWVPPPEDSPLPPADERTSPVPAPVRRRTMAFDPGRRGVVALALVAAVAAALAGGYVLRARPVEVAAPSVDQVGVGMGPSASPSPGLVVVSVGGKVRRPGLVRLPAGSRVDDAVRAAGGATAPVGLLNLARRLMDGEQVLVGVAGTAANGSAPDAPVDLNAATVEQLDALPGIGPVLAERIVDWRTEHGRFASVDQLREVPGIGESKYLQIKAKVSV